ncbi:MlaD family protein [Carboxylicivirga sp. N1Y90]|uniref:MlaD family protein n=1 Tax=Carboxylicivirga fragile TaxID=3417571 RepID=UPI003D3387FF|nr:MCE family protein [Marinilabiliaceae bacterium N1Y90]
MKKEFKIGLTVFAAFIIIIWGLNFLSGRDIFRVGDYYYGVYARIDGLTKASPVFYRGFKVGAVRDIDFHSSKSDMFIVTFQMNKDLILPKDSRAQIYSLDLMGSKGVQFLPGSDTELLAMGDTMNTSVMGDLKDQVSMEVLPLKDKAERLIVQLDSVFTNLGDIVNEDNKANLSKSIESFSKSMDNFERLSASLANKMDDDGDVTNMISRMDSLMIVLNAQAPYIDTTFKSLAGFSQQLEAAQIDESLAALKTTLGQTSLLLTSINQSEGTLGLLLSDKELYYSLTDVSANLNRLLIDVRHHPDRYVNFSAVNVGKKVVVSDNAYGIHGVIYQIVLKQSKKPLKMDSVVVNSKYRVFEDYRKSRYYYSIAQSESFVEIQKIFEEIKPQFEESCIVAFENGEEISLKKAQKLTR